MTDQDNAEIFMPPHPIAEKVEKGGPMALTEADLERTDRQIMANFGAQYRDWVADDVENLEWSLTQIEQGGPDLESATVTFRKLAHEIRGMGGTFGYGLITAIGDQMYRMAASFEAIDEDQAQALRLHLDAIKVVVADDIKGDGGERGREMLDGLQGVYQKYASDGAV